MVGLSLISRGVLLLTIIASIYYSLLLIIQCFQLRRFKGPLPLPWVGNCYDTTAFYVMKYLSILRKRYGKIFTFFAFTKPYLVVCDPAVVRRILSDPKTFPKGPDYTKSFRIAFGEGLVTSNGEKHRNDKGIFGRFFIRSNVIKFVDLINELAIEAINQSLLSNGANNTKKSYNIEEFFAVLALRTFSLFSMNIDYRKNPKREKEICHMVSSGSFKIGQILALNLPLWKIFPQVAECIEVRHQISNDLKNPIKERKEMIDKGLEVPDDCLTAMIKENMPLEVMFDHIVTLLSAGHDTTAFYASYFCYLLGQYPTAQDKIVEEIHNVVGDREYITADDVSEMKYLQKALQECLRMYAIIPNISRVATSEVHIKEANVTIPKGATVMIPMFLINRDPDIWENPSEFNPERFEGKGSEYFTNAKSGFFPFGYGSRTCIGNILAQLESSIFITQILRRFRIEADPGFKPNIMAGISLTTSNGINVVLRQKVN